MGKPKLLGGSAEWHCEQAKRSSSELLAWGALASQGMREGENLHSPAETLGILATISGQKNQTISQENLQVASGVYMTYFWPFISVCPC